jgi:type I restriction enzyme S subunit
MELRPGYKQTDLGVIPTDWEIYTIGNAMRLINGRAFKLEDWKDFGLPIIRIQNLNDPETRFNYFAGPVEDKHRIEAGDLLFAWSGTTGTSFGARVWNGPAGVLNQHIFKVIPDQTKLTPAFAFLALRKVQESIEKHAHGFKASFVHVKKSDLIGVSLPAPKTKTEQDAIAETLSDAEAHLESIERLIATKRKIKQGAMQELLTGRKRLPGFNGDWALKRLSDVTDTDPQSLGGDTRPDFAFNYIALEDVDLGTLASYSEQLFQTAPSRARRRLRKYDILVSTVRPNLKSHLLFLNKGANWVCSTGFCVVRSREGVTDPAYVYFQMFGDYVARQIEALLTGSNYPAINSRDVRALQIPLPEYDEQAAIAAVLTDMDVEIAALEARLAKARQLQQGMMQELLTGKVRLV